MPLACFKIWWFSFFLLILETGWVEEERERERALASVIKGTYLGFQFLPPH